MSEIQQALVGLFEEILKTLPSNAASLNVVHHDAKTGQIVELEMRPRNPLSAPVVAAATADSVSLKVGREDNYIEWIIVKQTEITKVVAEVKAICQAAIEGRVSETVWSRPMPLRPRVRTKIDLGTHVIETGYGVMPINLWPLGTTFRKYVPYDARPSADTGA